MTAQFLLYFLNYLFHHALRVSALGIRKKIRTKLSLGQTWFSSVYALCDAVASSPVQKHQSLGSVLKCSCLALVLTSPQQARQVRALEQTP